MGGFVLSVGGLITPNLSRATRSSTGFTRDTLPECLTATFWQDEFPSTRKAFKKVRSAWKAYFTHLSEKPPDDLQIQPVFFAKRQELLTDLLYEMATALKYDFDKTQISKDVYSTVYHEKLEADQQTIRTKLVEILTGKAALPMAVVQFPNDPDFIAAQADYLKLMAEHLRAGRPWPIAIVGGDAAGKVIPMRAPDQKNDAPGQQASGGA